MNETKSLGRAEGALEPAVNIRNILGENSQYQQNKKKKKKKKGGGGERFEALGLRLTTRA